jgi:ATP-binding protein involved in chromosome partitioning
MAYFAGPDGSELEIFGRGGAQKMSEALKIPFLGEVPLDPALRKGCDDARPLTALEPDGAMASRFKVMAQKVLDGLGK